MFAAKQATALQNVQKASDVVLRIGPGIFQRITDASLGRQMYRKLKSLPRIDFLKRGLIADVHMEELELGRGLQQLKTIALELDVVVVVKIVDADNGTTQRQQPAA